MSLKRKAYTLVEVMVTVGILSGIIAAVMSEYISLLRGYETVQVYRDLHAQARFGIDEFTRDMRQASAILSGTSNSVRFSKPTATATQTVTYAQNGSKFSRTLVSGGTTNTTDFASEVESVHFDYYLRDNSTASNATMAFNVHAKITCSKGVSGYQKVDFIHTRTLMRNKHS